MLKQPTTRRIKVVEVELSRPLTSLTGLAGYTRAQCLLRWHGDPIGYAHVPVRGDTCHASDLEKAIAEEHGYSTLRQFLRNALHFPAPPNGWSVKALFEVPRARKAEHLPTISVAVCTRDRTADLTLCLEALQRLSYQPLEILVIDNAPKTNGTRELIADRFPHVRYVCEPRPGLDWARNRAIIEARGEILAYTDDDVIVDSGWTRAIAEVFAENPDATAVTGLVVPHELETEAQLLFEEYGGFGRGFHRRWYRTSGSIAREHGGAGKFGTGANMAFRRSAFAKLGMFDPALDVGTVTQGGGDLDMYFRVLKHGHTLVYEPAAIVRHRHRREYDKLRWQLASNGVGFYSHIVRNLLAWRDERRGFVSLAAWWLKWWNFRRLAVSLFKPVRVPREIIWGELKGSFIGLGRYQKARKAVEEIEKEFGPQPTPVFCEETTSSLSHAKSGIAIRRLDLSAGVQTIADVTEYYATQVIFTWRDRPLAQIEIANCFQPISADRLIDAATQELGLKLLDPFGVKKPDFLWAETMTQLEECLEPAADERKQSPAALPKSLSVSVIVATRDRPEDLRRCLQSLASQVTVRSMEIIVVDNNPKSGLTPPALAEFPEVLLISEQRQGLSYARNAGFNAAHGDILVCTDDDVITPPDWIEKLMSSFSRNDVMLVTGNVFPVELETKPQMEFERYGGLGRGFERREFDRDWFDSFRKKAVPTWMIGATANAAVRASVLAETGLLDESLGAGTVTGCSEDTDLFYRILKAGHTIIYDPSAYVWHKHRCTEASASNQIFNYSKGHVAYNLLTFLRDGDGRGLVRVCIELPLHHLRQIGGRLLGKHHYPSRLTLREVKGNLLGAIALWKSRRRVRMLGPSDQFKHPQPVSTFPLDNSAVPSVRTATPVTAGV